MSKDALDKKSRTIAEEIKSKIGTLDKVRGTRIRTSERLNSYSSMWRLIFFIMNLEAVIFILISLGNQNINLVFIGDDLPLLAGTFSIYTILVQYYVNGLNYNERALKAHYHQLEIEDLNLVLENLLIKWNSEKLKLEKQERNDNPYDNPYIETYNEVMSKYQLVLKSNENHGKVDFKRMIVDLSKTKEKIRDFSLDNIFLYCNLLIIICLLVIIIWSFV